MTTRRPLMVLAILSLTIAFMTSAPTTRAMTPPAPSALTPWLDELVARWDALTPASQRDAAEVFGRTHFTPAVETLTHCALNLPKVAEACTTALAAQRDPAVVPTLREVIRQAASPGAVTAAAHGLKAYRDRFSADLLLMALVTGRGGPDAAGALIDAYEARTPEWADMYLTHVALTAPHPTSRALAAARALPQATPATHDRLRAALEEVISHWWTTPKARAADRRAAGQAVTILSRDDPGCRRVLRLTAGPPGTHTRDEALRAWLPPGCDTTARAHRSARSTTSGGVASPPAPASRETRLRLLAQNVAQPLHPAAMSWLDTQLADGPWGAGAVTSLTADVDAYRRRTEAQLASLSEGDVFPEDFHGFGSYLKQPAWYPRHVHITIDDGPRPVALPAILDTLADHEVKATFFFVGAVLTRFWNEDSVETQTLVRRVVDEGHAIGYHSMNHVTAPSEHIRMWEPDQVTDSVNLFRAVLTHVLGKTHPVTIGRLPGGMGMRLPWVRRSFFDAGLYQHVHWNAGPPYWSRTSTLADVRGQSCGIVRRDKPVVILLHEYVHTYRHIDAFLTQIRAHCPVEKRSNAHVGERAQWGRR